MTTRSDVEVDFELTPRLADITSASEEITVQDSHDTLSTIQDSGEGGQYEFLVGTTGGEPLGGGVTVGLTTVLNNLQYAFQATSPVSVGSVTLTDANGVVLTDSVATFIADGVKRGDWVINFSDQSVTEVLTVNSETQLTTRGLRNGTNSNFTNSDAYKVWEVSEAELSGGNFTAVDGLGADLNPLFPSFGRFITRTAAASATTANQEQLEHGTFGGVVAVSPTGLNSVPGTAYPAGTFKTPSNNMVDALAIAVRQGLRRIVLLEDITISEDLSVGYTVEGVSPFIVATLTPAADVTGCAFTLITLAGVLDGLNTVRQASLALVTGVNGFLFQVAFTAEASVMGDTLIMQCFSHREGGLYPLVRVVSGNVIVRDFRGSFGLADMTAGVHSIGVSGGRVVIEASCVGGEIHVRGEPFEIVDNSGPLCVVIDETEGKKLRDIHGQVVRSVFVNTENTNPGVGYQQEPYNTWTAAVDDAEANGLNSLRLLADATVDRQIKNFTITGEGLPSIDLAGQNMDKTTIERCTVTGSYLGAMQVVESAIVNLSGMAGAFLTISASGTLTAAPNASLLITNVQPASPSAPWTLDMNTGQPSTVGVHNISGEINVTNMDDAGDTLHLHFDQGEVNIAASCTAGTLVVTGDAEVTGGSAGVTLINNTSNKILREAHTRLGLEAGNAWTDTPTQSGDASGDIIIDNTGDGVATSTGTRQ